MFARFSSAFDTLLAVFLQKGHICLFLCLASTSAYFRLIDLPYLAPKNLQRNTKAGIGQQDMPIPAIIRIVVYTYDAGSAYRSDVKRWPGANGKSAIWRARLMAWAKARWCFAQLPVCRRGRIFPCVQIPVLRAFLPPRIFNENPAHCFGGSFEVVSLVIPALIL